MKTRKNSEFVVITVDSCYRIAKWWQKWFICHSFSTLSDWIANKLLWLTKFSKHSIAFFNGFWTQKSVNGLASRLTTFEALEVSVKTAESTQLASNMFVVVVDVVLIVGPKSVCFSVCALSRSESSFHAISTSDPSSVRMASLLTNFMIAFYRFNGFNREKEREREFGSIGQTKSGLTGFAWQTPVRQHLQHWQLCSLNLQCIDELVVKGLP